MISYEESRPFVVIVLSCSKHCIVPLFWMHLHIKQGEAEDTYGSRSPPYENERRYSDRPSPGGRSDGSSRNSYDERRSPGYDQDFKKSPARVDVVNDWRREDRFGNGRSSDGGSKVEGRSPDRRRDPEISSPPIVRPVRDILGESVSPLRVIEPPRANGSRPVDGSLQTQVRILSIWVYAKLSSVLLVHTFVDCPIGLQCI